MFANSQPLRSFACAVALITISSFAHDAQAAKWDCAVNKTGKTLRVVVLSEKATLIFAKVLPNQRIEFRVEPQPKMLALVTFEFNSNNLITLTAFKSLPQQWKPQICYPIQETTPKPSAADRDQESERDEAEEPITEETL